MEVSRFASAYRSQFGESASLRSKRQQSPISGPKPSALLFGTMCQRWRLRDAYRVTATPCESPQWQAVPDWA
jgi:hypothetical protein